MLPDYRSNRGCKRDCKRKCGFGARNTRTLIGLSCILLGVLILLICAPEWLVALIVACLLFAAGLACLGRRL